VNAQAILRRLTEDFSKTTRFILTCNYPQKILAPIRSRCQEFEFKPMSEKDMINYIVNILNKEKIDCNPEDVLEIIRAYKPDIRKIINTLQLNINKNNKIQIDKKNIAELDVNSKILELIEKPNSFNKIRKLIADNNISKFIEIYQYLYKNIEKVCNDKEKLLEYYIKIAEYLYRDSIIADGEINFMGFISDIQK
jgi:replication factor C small subunit